MIKIEIKTIAGAIAFTWESKTNTVKETVKELLKKYGEKWIKDLNLSNMDLSGIDFSNSSFDNSRFYNSSFDNSSFDNSRFDNSSEIKKSCDLKGLTLNQTIFASKRYIQITSIGSTKRITTYCFEDNTIWCGCFKGTLAAFEKKVKETHADNEQFLKEYIGFINYIKSLK